MANYKVVVMVICDCKAAVNLRAHGVRKSVLCWNCGKEVGFEMRGWMKAEGYTIVNFERKTRPATVISQEEE